MRPGPFASRLLCLLHVLATPLAVVRAQTTPPAPPASTSTSAKIAASHVATRGSVGTKQAVALTKKSPHYVRNPLIIFAAIGGAIVLVFALHHHRRACVPSPTIC